MVEEQNISNMTQNELLVSLYKDLQRSEQERQKQAELLEKLKNNADTGIKPDMNLQKELEEAKKRAQEADKLSEERKKLQELLAARDNDLSSLKKSSEDKEKELQKLAEIKQLQDAQYNELKNRLEMIESHKKSEELNRKKSTISEIVAKYVALGLVDNTDESKLKKMNDLMGMEDSHISEVSRIIDRQLQTTPANIIPSSQTAQADKDIEKLRNDKTLSRNDKLDALFNRLGR